MRNLTIILIVLLSVFNIGLSAARKSSTTLRVTKEKVSPRRANDTIYYNNDWAIMPRGNKNVYYRIVNSAKKAFTTHFMDGKLQSTCGYVKLDSLNDFDSQFRGPWKSFYHNGMVQAEGVYADGKKEGEWTVYYPDSMIRSHANYHNGMIEGMFTEFYLKGDTCLHTLYKDGVPAEDFYYVSTRNGLFQRFDINTNNPITERVAPIKMSTDTFADGVYKVYSNNSVVLALNISPIKDYGSYYNLNILLVNNSFQPVVLDPSSIYATYVDKKGEVKDLDVIWVDEYAYNLQSSNIPWQYGSENDNNVYRTIAQRRNMVCELYEDTTKLQPTSAEMLKYQRDAIEATNMDEYCVALTNNNKRQLVDMGYIIPTVIYPTRAAIGKIYLNYKKCSKMNVIIEINGVPYEFPWTFENN